MWNYLKCVRPRRCATRFVALLCAACAAFSLQAQDRNAKPPELKLSTAQAPSFPLGQAGE